MTLTESNYFSNEANHEYMSNSQFKHFLNCEASAIANIDTESIPNTAMQIGRAHV